MAKAKKETEMYWVIYLDKRVGRCFDRKQAYLTEVEVRKLIQTKVEIIATAPNLPRRKVA